MSERHVYEYDVDTTSDTAPARVTRIIGTGKSVVDVGAGPGSITRILTRNGNRVTALELDDKALEILRPHCERAIRVDLNDPQSLRAIEERFDVAVAADVLEHVYDPWRVLADMKSLLKPSGSIVLSLPHVGHSALHACMFQEDFSYNPWGLLDGTHIRFFGIKNIQQLIERAGLKIVEAEFVTRSPSETEFAEVWQRLPADMRAMLERNRFGRVYQVVTRSVPVEAEGAAIDLMRLPVDGRLDPIPISEPAGAIDVRSHAARVPKALKDTVRRHLGPGAIRQIRSIAERMHIRM